MTMHERMKLQMYLWTQRDLIDRLEHVLRLMSEERDLASTHSQRNAFQHVIRVHLEAVLHDVQFCQTPDSDDITAVPF